MSVGVDEGQDCAHEHKRATDTGEDTTAPMTATSNSDATSADGSRRTGIAGASSGTRGHESAVGALGEPITSND